MNMNLNKHESSHNDAKLSTTVPKLDEEDPLTVPINDKEGPILTLNQLNFDSSLTQNDNWCMKTSSCRGKRTLDIQRTKSRKELGS